MRRTPVRLCYSAHRVFGFCVRQTRRRAARTRAESSVRAARHTPESGSSATFMETRSKDCLDHLASAQRRVACPRLSRISVFRLVSQAMQDGQRSDPLGAPAVFRRARRACRKAPVNLSSTNTATTAMRDRKDRGPSGRPSCSIDAGTAAEFGKAPRQSLAEQPSLIRSSSRGREGLVEWRGQRGPEPFGLGALRVPARASEGSLGPRNQFTCTKQRPLPQAGGRGDNFGQTGVCHNGPALLRTRCRDRRCGPCLR